MKYFAENYWLVRLLFQRGLAGIYLVAFISALNQFRPLLGENGLLPVPKFLMSASYIQAPSIFHWHYSDRFFAGVAWLGIILSSIAVLGISESGPLWLSITVWLILWVLYLSIVNVGQTFYAFGWESMLLEAGFFAVFLGPARMEPSFIPVLILRWMLFRVELGAGLIKVRHDVCWRKLTCLFYHYETQPLPNPLSWYFHRLPKFFHRASVAGSHFVQLVVPFFLFAPQPFASAAGALIIFHQLWLIISGNYSWLNWLTVVLGITAFSDSALELFIPFAPAAVIPRLLPYDIILYALAAVTAVLSIKPVQNLFSKNQLMNYSYNPFHIVGTYGAFGSVTKERYEIILEGTDDAVINEQTRWREYEFKGKPVNIKRRPPQVAPYHLRLDWLMWFLPFSVMVTDRGILNYGHELWFLRFVQKLLEGEGETLRLLKGNAFPEKPPRFVRALFYRYRYTSRCEKRETGAWWNRNLIDVYLPPVSLERISTALSPYFSSGRENGMTGGDADKKPVMLFDGACGFCRKWIAKWQRVTGDKVIYAPYQEALGNYPQVSEEQCEKAVQLILPGGEVYSGAHAAFKALALAGKYRRLLWLYERLPLFARASEAFYQWVARHRGMLAR